MTQVMKELKFYKLNNKKDKSILKFIKIFKFIFFIKCCDAFCKF